MPRKNERKNSNIFSNQFQMSSNQKTHIHYCVLNVAHLFVFIAYYRNDVWVDYYSPQYCVFILKPHVSK